VLPKAKNVVVREPRGNHAKWRTLLWRRLEEQKQGCEKKKKKWYLKRKREHGKGVTCQLSKSHGAYSYSLKV